MKPLSIKQENAIVKLTVKLGQAHARRIKERLGLTGIATVDLTGRQAYLLIEAMVKEIDRQKRVKVGRGE